MSLKFSFQSWTGWCKAGDGKQRLMSHIPASPICFCKWFYFIRTQTYPFMVTWSAPTLRIQQQSWGVATDPVYMPTSKCFSIWYFIEKFTKFCPSQFGSLMTLGHSLCSPSSRPTPFHSLQFLAVTSTSQACSCPEAFTPTLFSAWNVLSRIFAQLAPLSSSSLHSNNLLSGALSNHLICNYNPPGYTP